MPQKIPVRSKKRNPVNHVADQKNMKYRGEEIDKNAKKIWAKKQIVETLYLSKCNISLGWTSSFLCQYEMY